MKATAELMGVRSVAADLGWNFGLRVYVDSSAAKAISSRTGIGRVRHLEVRFLWLQDVVRKRIVQILKVRGSENPADVLTKVKSFGDAIELLRVVHVSPVPCSTLL